MSRRERVLLILGLVVAIGLVVYPLAYRISTEQASAGVAPTPAPTLAVAATPTPRPTVTATPVVFTPPPVEPDWLAEAQDHRGANGQTFVYRCSPNGIYGQVWGTDIYTDDSSVCTAGVHRGVITREAGGIVRIIIRPAIGSYEGTTRNGVTTELYGSWEGSYEIEAP